MIELHGRVAVVTGAASGIGAATARLFAQAGADLALAGFSRDGHDIEPVRRDILDMGRRVVVADVDVRKTRDVDALVTSTLQEFGRIDIVIANAAIARDVASPDLSDGAWDDVLNVDLTGVWRCFRAALPTMMDQKYGRLLATSSAAGVVEAWPRHAHYTAAKAGILGLVKTLAVELGPQGITVNAICPGLITTPQSLDPVHSLGPELVAAQAGKIPVRRVGEPIDIANAFLFFASGEASYVTGQFLVVDGGRTLSYDWSP